jgi:hypothetical protein
VSDQESQPEESADLLENGQINLAGESQEVELSNPEQTEVILRRQGEHAERKLIEEIYIENSDSGEVKATEIMTKCKEVSSAPHIPYVEKEGVNNPSMPKSSIKTKIVEVRGSRVNCLATNVVVNNRLNDFRLRTVLKCFIRNAYLSYCILVRTQKLMPTNQNISALNEVKESTDIYTGIILCIGT